MVEAEAAWQADLLVLGAGMAGLTAAARAAAQGARVVVVEKEADIGGSAAISGGHLWTVPSVEAFTAECPGGDLTLARQLVGRFPDAVSWVAASGAWMSPELTVLGYGRGHRMDVLAYLTWCRRTVEAAGGVVLTSRRVDSLLAENGRVVGARCFDRDGAATLRAPWTVLATGGFQGDNLSVATHIAPPEHVLLRSNPGSTGDGLSLGLAVGAAPSAHLNAFYGHLVTWPLPRFAPPDFVRFSLFYSNLGVLLDTAGRRFVDESHADHHNAQAVARTADGRALLLLDEDAYQVAVRTPAATGMDKPDPFAEGAGVGAHAVTASTLDEVAATAAGWGFDGVALRDTVIAYNRRLESDRDPAPGRRRYRSPFVTAPFRAVEVRAGITMTHGGLRVNEHAQVLDAGGLPVAGLLAAGADAGGLNDGGYAGGLAAATVFGLAAATTASA